MRVVDSSAWVEWLVGSELSKSLKEHMPAPTECVVPTIVQLELAKWLYREKDEEAVDSFIAYTSKCMVVVLDTVLARRAAEVSKQHKLAMADAIVYATAEQQQADILTCDAHFADLSGVIYIPK